MGTLWRPGVAGEDRGLRQQSEPWRDGLLIFDLIFGFDIMNYQKIHHRKVWVDIPTQPQIAVHCIGVRRFGGVQEMGCQDAGL